MQVRTSERIIRAEWRYRVRTGVLEYSNLHTPHLLPKPSSSSSRFCPLVSHPACDHRRQESRPLADAVGRAW